MDKNRSELFGKFNYDESLTYEELLGLETSFTHALEDLLTRAGGTHLDFTPEGDSLLFQCAFAGHKTYIYRKIAQELAAITPGCVNGRLLCVDKSLDCQHIYWISAGEFREEERLIPPLAPEESKIWKTACQDRRQIEVGAAQNPPQRTPGWWNW